MPRPDTVTNDDLFREPVRASEVGVETELSSDEIEEQKAAEAVAGRKARREVLRRSGAIGSSGLHDRLEARLKNIDRSRATDFRARQAVRQKLRDPGR